MRCSCATNTTTSMTSNSALEMTFWSPSKKQRSSPRRWARRRYTGMWRLVRRCSKKEWSYWSLRTWRGDRQPISTLGRWMLAPIWGGGGVSGECIVQPRRQRLRERWTLKRRGLGSPFGVAALWSLGQVRHPQTPQRPFLQASTVVQALSLRSCAATLPGYIVLYGLWSGACVCIYVRGGGSLGEPSGWDRQKRQKSTPDSLNEALLQALQAQAFFCYWRPSPEGCLAFPRGRQTKQEMHYHIPPPPPILSPPTPPLPH